MKEYREVEEGIGETQFGLRKGLGTRKALFSMQVLGQRCRVVNCNVFLGFIDFDEFRVGEWVLHSKGSNITPCGTPALISFMYESTLILCILFKRKFVN